MLDAFIDCCVGRRDDYAVQRADGRYSRSCQSISYEVVFQHLQGVHTIGSYMIDEYGFCRSAVFDSDQSTGLADLFRLQTTLAGMGVSSYQERSRRGSHLHIFFARPTLPALVRAWLLPYCPGGVEFYPKQDVLTPDVPLGSLIRLPLGIHRLTGERYPFVTSSGGSCVPVASSIADMLHWFTTVQRVTVPSTVTLPIATNVQPPTNTIPFKKPLASLDVGVSIVEWCRQQDPLDVIGRYVELNEKGSGCCPFGLHHAGGIDTHPSFFVYRPTYPDVRCWYCHTWKQGGSLFDFLRYYYGLNARELWAHILAGGRF